MRDPVLQTDNPALERINTRYYRSPFHPWPSDGTLPHAGLLVHCFDGLEHPQMKWIPRWQDEKTEQLRPIGSHCHKCGTRHSWDQSSSVIFAEQTLHLNGSAVRHCYTRRGSDFTRCKTLVPRDFVFSGGCHDGGIIFRPGVAKVKCGNAHDSGHVCHMFCPSPGSSSQTEEDPAHPCRSWAPADIHHYLRIETDARRKDEEGPSPPTFRYNEFIADGSWWDGHLPEVIEAFLRGNKHDNATAALHAKFLSTYGVKPKDVPLIEWTDDNRTYTRDARVAPPFRIAN